MSTNEISKEALEHPIINFVNALGNWDTSLFKHQLPTKIVEHIYFLQAPTPDQGSKACYWNKTTNEEVLHFLSNFDCKQIIVIEPDNRLKRVWKWPGTQRTRSFLLVTSEKEVTHQL